MGACSILTPLASILINTVEKARCFVALANKHRFDIFAEDTNGIVVDAKSILGIFSINLLRPINLYIRDSNEETELLISDIKEYLSTAEGVV